MSQILQLVKKPRIIKITKSRSLKLLKNPQKRGVCIKVLTISLKNPNQLTVVFQKLNLWNKTATNC